MVYGLVFVFLAAIVARVGWSIGGSVVLYTLNQILYKLNVKRNGFYVSLS